ncbi:hypothetical protein [Cronobacter sakazakii]|uniref:hypothetical protein n=1 Tax=Cronobacter sakazakii TaxID=28141 RepID=UPI000CFABE71|nr:hypothetical protein [Cronobacter sakazakii]EMA4768711.1 hypothetical protein [Cronobacter sakazakii]PQY42521.1 hypothetical protein C5947_01590 [Cronobacter sakazakii]
MNTAKLKAAAERQKSILECIASFEPADIDSDTVDLRFEDENGCDTGCDVSIVEECRRSADFVGELITALEAIAQHAERGWQEAHEQEARAEAAEKRIAELEARTLEVIIPPRLCHDYAAVAVQQRDEQWYKALHDACDRTGINLEAGGEA